MVTLEKFRGKIVAFLDEALPRFAAKHPKEKPTTIGLYSSPGNGWVSLCINTGDTPTTNEQNCPDFKFVEFDLIELPEWLEEYESEKPKIKISATKTISPNPDDGDEGYNEPFFNFLVVIAKDYFTGVRCPDSVMWVGVQMLDSGFEEFWMVGKAPAKSKFKSPVIQPHKKAARFIFSRDEKQVFYQVGNTLMAMDLATREILFAVKPTPNVSQMDLSPDGSHLVVKNTSGRTLVLDAQSGKTVSDFKNHREGEGDAVLFSPCGNFVVTVTWYGLLNVRDAKTGKVVFEDLQDGCMLVSLSTPADRRFVIYFCRRCQKLIRRSWPLQDGNSEEISVESERHESCVVSPSGTLLASAQRKELRVINLHDGKCVAKYPVSHHVYDVAWSPDEKFVAISDGDIYRVLQMPPLTLKHEFSLKYSYFITFSPSSKYLAFDGHIVPMDYLEDFIRGIKPKA